MNALFLAPMVIARRMPQLMFEAMHPNPMIREESKLAVSEKVEAFSEGMMAGQIAAFNAPMTMMLDMMAGRSPLSAAMGAQQKIARAASGPIEKKLRHNHRRLSKAAKPR